MVPIRYGYGYPTSRTILIIIPAFCIRVLPILAHGQLGDLLGQLALGFRVTIGYGVFFISMYGKIYYLNHTQNVVFLDVVLVLLSKAHLFQTTYPSA